MFFILDTVFTNAPRGARAPGKLATPPMQAIKVLDPLPRCDHPLAQSGSVRYLSSPAVNLRQAVSFGIPPSLITTCALRCLICHPEMSISSSRAHRDALIIHPMVLVMISNDEIAFRLSHNSHNS